MPAIRCAAVTIPPGVKAAARRGTVRAPGRGRAQRRPGRSVTRSGCGTSRWRKLPSSTGIWSAAISRPSIRCAASTDTAAGARFDQPREGDRCHDASGCRHPGGCPGRCVASVWSAGAGSPGRYRGPTGLQTATLRPTLAPRPNDRSAASADRTGPSAVPGEHRPSRVAAAGPGAAPRPAARARARGASGWPSSRMITEGHRLCQDAVLDEPRGTQACGGPWPSQLAGRWPAGQARVAMDRFLATSPSPQCGYGGRGSVAEAASSSWP